MGLQNGAVYVLRNVKGGTVLDLDYAKDGKTLHGWEYHQEGKDNQKWKAIDQGNGWVFQSLQNGHYLSVEAHNLADGLGLAATDNDQTLWYVVQDDWEREHGYDVYRLVIKNSHYSLDLADHGNPKNGTPITIWGTWKGTNQLWRFQKVN